MVNDGAITHVSDTALMVAACRAWETETADGFVRDPFAARLAGARGMAILEAMPHAGMARFGLGLRSRFLDELLMEALAAHPIATVLSLGCGLDTRPWRLEVPAELRWIEVDFAAMLDYKESLMAGETARCRRERMVADLNDGAQRRRIWEAAGTGPALMITEGLLMYLPAATVEALAAEARQESPVKHWMSDIATSAFSKAVMGDTDKDWRQPLRHVQAPDYLEGEQILERVYRLGWETEAHRSYIRDVGFAAERIQRMMAGAARPASPPAFVADDPTGVHLFARGEG